MDEITINISTIPGTSRNKFIYYLARITSIDIWKKVSKCYIKVFNVTRERNYKCID